MAFRQDVRSKVLVWSGAVRIDQNSLLDAAPKEPDALDEAIAVIAAHVLAGAQFDAFYLRYFGNESDPADRQRMEQAYVLRRFPDGADRVASFDPISRNSNRALERLFDILHKPTASRDYRGTILESWKNAQENAQRRDD